MRKKSHNKQKLCVCVCVCTAADTLCPGRDGLPRRRFVVGRVVAVLVHPIIVSAVNHHRLVAALWSDFVRLRRLLQANDHDAGKCEQSAVKAGRDANIRVKKKEEKKKKGVGFTSMSTVTLSPAPFPTGVLNTDPWKNDIKTTGSRRVNAGGRRRSGGGATRCIASTRAALPDVWWACRGRKHRVHSPQCPPFG